LQNFIKVEDYRLTHYNTLRIRSTAQLIVFPLNNDGIKEIFEEYGDRKIIFLGNGSNILLSKRYYDENYLFVSFKHMEDIYFKDGIIFAQSGVTLSQLSWFALELGIQGYEFLEDIPGSIGGAVVMNAGTYQDMIGQLISTVTYYSVEDNEIRTDDVKANDFGKRFSTWGARGDIILSVTFELEEKDRLTYYEPILDELQANKKRRYMKQPRNYPNAGSVFKRPSKDGKDYYVWQLFEGCDLRGHRIGNAMISDKHPGFIVNMHDAEPEDILELINLAKTSVKEKYDIDLELEWIVI
jgi:UDP-N-acetylmuramate dehydrogenase